MKRALIVGIDQYPRSPLGGCVNDAKEIATLLRSNSDESPNFDIRLLRDSEAAAGSFTQALKKLFSGRVETALLYFAGHGLIDAATGTGHLVTFDGQDPHWGISLTDIIGMANDAAPEIQSTVIILDSCHSGYAGNVPGLGNDSDLSLIGPGTTVLTACHREGTAAEKNGHGTFTSILLDGLRGAASDVLGRVTPAALYTHVDQTLGAWEQRPVYKANVQRFITLREVAPKVPLDILRRLPQYFPRPDHHYQLDPSHEPDRGDEVRRLSGVAVVPQNVKIYRDLQMCNRASLVVPIDHDHMWHAAVHNGSCKLTATGMHYRYLAERNKI